MDSALQGYEEFCCEHLHSLPGTIYRYKLDITRFLHYLESHNINTLTEIQSSMLSNFMLSRAHLATSTLSNIASALRSFLRYLCMKGIISENLIAQVPKMNIKADQRIPTVWDNKDINALLAVLDRTSPVGKRDYAILLLAIRLGMRVSDIRTLCFEHLLWDQARIEKRQVKGGAMLCLPLTNEVGNALIDYLRYGRPQTIHREIFLRANAPFEPFGSNNNFHYIITKYRRLAGINLNAKNRCGMHSLRHTLASRLLEAGVGLESISGILGHVSQETTRIYTKIDIRALRTVAINPEEVTNE